MLQHLHHSSCHLLAIKVMMREEWRCLEEHLIPAPDDDIAVYNSGDDMVLFKGYLFIQSCLHG